MLSAVTPRKRPNHLLPNVTVTTLPVIMLPTIFAMLLNPTIAAMARLIFSLMVKKDLLPFLFLIGFIQY